MLDVFKTTLRAARIYWMDFCNDVKHSTLIKGKFYSQESLLSSMVVDAHTIEKGLTMPHKKLFFGKDKIQSIVNDCRHYLSSGYNPKEQRFVYVAGILAEYIDYHSVNKCEIGGG